MQSNITADAMEGRLITCDHIGSKFVYHGSLMGVGASEYSLIENSLFLEGGNGSSQDMFDSKLIPSS